MKFFEERFPVYYLTLINPWIVTNNAIIIGIDHNLYVK